MIEYIRGELSELTPAMAVVDAGGVGYGMGISLNTYSAIQGKKQVKLYVFESIREDAYQLSALLRRQNVLCLYSSSAFRVSERIRPV